MFFPVRSGRLLHFRFSGLTRRESVVPGRVVGLRREPGSTRVFLLLSQPGGRLQLLQSIF
jgi:hypothetical protein